MIRDTQERVWICYSCADEDGEAFILVGRFPTTKKNRFVLYTYKKAVKGDRERLNA